MEIVKALLNSGAHLNTHNPLSGDTALMDAVNLGYLAVVRLMIANGADVNATGKWGETVLSQVISARESAARLGRAGDAHKLAQIIQVLQSVGAR